MYRNETYMLAVTTEEGRYARRGRAKPDAGEIEVKKSIETLNAVAVEIADDMIGRIKRRKKEDRRSENKIKDNGR